MTSCIFYYSRTLYINGKITDENENIGVILSGSSVLNSTERLLNTIRGSDSIPIDNIEPVNFTEQSVSIEHMQTKSMTAGILIDNGYIALVLSGANKTTHTQELLKWSYITIPDSMDPSHIRFSAFLRNTLENFLGKFKQAEIWSIVDTKNFKLRNIIIPNIPTPKIPNAAMWEFKKEFEILPDEEIFDFQISGTIQVDGIKKKKIVAFSAEKEPINILNSVFSKAGFPLTGITALPFAFHNFIKNDIIPNKAPFVITNISRHYSNIFCLSSSGVLLVRNIKTGAYSLVEDLLDTDGSDSDDTIDVPELLNFDTHNPLFDKISHSSDRLISKIVRTGDYCSNNLTKNDPMEAYLFFGETDKCEAFLTSAQEQIPSNVSIFNPFEGANISSTLKINPPLNPTHRNGIIPAFAISLSSNEDTPNFLYTYVHKEAQAKQKKINLSIIGTCAACLLVCFALWFWLSGLEKKQSQNIANIDRQLSKYTPNVNQDIITQKLIEAKKKSTIIQKYTSDYNSLAVINEICSKTPDNIFIISLNADFKIPVTLEKNKKGMSQNRLMILKGMVKADYTALESTLTGYIIKLGDSPFFKDILLRDKKIDTDNDENTLIFTTVMEIL